MASKVTVQTAPASTPDSTQRLSTKSRIGTFAVLGSALAVGAGAAATYFMGKDAAVKMVEGFFSKYVTLPDLSKVGYGLSNLAGNGTIVALGSGAALLGAGVGAATGQASAHKASLNDVKGQLGVAGSDLNFSQMHRIADVAVRGGIFKGRSTSAQFKDDASRIRNLNRELSNTEFSLSSNAHNTSKARGVEDRFFDVEGARLANNSRSTGQFLTNLQALKGAVNAEVKATDKYTYQQGNSSTSIDRREYILAGIMGFAYERGIAANYLTAAVQERDAIAKTSPKQAEAHFRQAVQKGIEAGILSPANDAHAYEGMVEAAATASKATNHKNPDSVINSIFDSLKDAGMIDGNLRARFNKDVRAKMSNPTVQISNQIAQAPATDSPIDRLVKRSGLNAVQNGANGESVLEAPATESKSQMKARLAAEEKARADAEVNSYADILASLDPRQKELADLYQKLIQLLNEKSIPLNQIMEMSTSKLRGAIAMRHKQGFDLFDQYEANDIEIAATRDRIAMLTDALDTERVARPENFSRASRAQKKAAESLESQVKAEDKRIAGLKNKANAIDAKIQKVEGTLNEDEGQATTFLYPASEETLPQPELPKQPGFFEKLFGKKKVEEAPVEGAKAEVAVEAPIAAPSEEEILVEEPIVGPADAQVNADDALPEPVVAKKSWKFWG